MFTAFRNGVTRHTSIWEPNGPLASDFCFADQSSQTNGSEPTGSVYQFGTAEATTTAMICGLVDVEFLKLVLGTEVIRSDELCWDSTVNCSCAALGPQEAQGRGCPG